MRSIWFLKALFYIAGCSGLGKSTFINSLFCTEVNNPDTQHRRIPPTVQIEQKIVRLVENGVTLNLTLVDCPGFGDAVDNSKWLVISLS